jgi:hypothetical protein
MVSPAEDVAVVAAGVAVEAVAHVPAVGAELHVPAEAGQDLARR